MKDPVFLRALEQGVEIGQDGELVGLIRVHRICGNDPYIWQTKRINLSDLAGFMAPDAIDDSIVHPDEIKLLKENEIRSLGHHGLPFLLLHKAYRVRRVYESAKGRLAEQADFVRYSSRKAIDE